MKAIRATLRAAVTEARANPGAFWSQLGAMAINDVVWVVFWVLFFHRVGSVRGWDQSRVLLLFAILTTGCGVVLSVLSNARRIGQLVADGGIDAALALPVPTLAYLLVRRLDAVNLGDVVFGVSLFCISGHPTVARTAIYLMGSLTGATIFASFVVMAGSLAFFVGRAEAGDLSFQGILMLASYPADIFGGATKIVLYTAVPAAFVAAVPARMVDDFNAATAVAVVGVAALFATGAWAVFSAGLRRYQSSAIWTKA